MKIGRPSTTSAPFYRSSTCHTSLKKKNYLAVRRCKTPYRSCCVDCRTRPFQKPAEYFEVHRDTPFITIRTTVVLFPYRWHCFNPWTYLALFNNRKIVIVSGNWTDWTRLSQFTAEEFSPIFSGWQSSSCGGPRAPSLKRRTFEPRDSAVWPIWCHRTVTVNVNSAAKLFRRKWRVTVCLVTGPVLSCTLVSASEGQLCSGVWNSDTFLCIER